MEGVSLRRVAPPGLVCLHWLRTRSNVAYSPEIVSDREYVEKRSLKLDLSVLLRAALAMAYGRPTQAVSSRVEMLGVTIDNLSLNDALRYVDNALEKGSTGSQISFVNADCLNKAAQDPQYKRLLNRASLVLADGIGVKIAGSLLSRPIRQNVNGTDMFPRLCEQLASKGQRLFLYGGRPEVLDALRQRVVHQYPGLVLCGAVDGYSREEEAVVAEIAAARPDVVLVALGAPKQDAFIARNLNRMQAKVCLGVGGLFDFYSGRIPRAPQWLRDAGLEWTYRLYQEPGRMWKRYLIGNFVFLARVVTEKVRASYSNSSKVFIG